MKSGSYHRIGNFDVWYGYKDDDVNYLRIDPFIGYPYTSAAEVLIIDESVSKTEVNGIVYVQGNTSRGPFRISRAQDGMVNIKLSRFILGLIPVWVSGVEKGSIESSLISKICEVNNI